MSWRRSVAAARRLAMRDWAELFEAWLELARSEATLRWLPFRCWRGQLVPTGGRDDVDAGLRVARAVGRAARVHGRDMTCLRRALAQRAMLRRRGVASTLRWGARRQGGGIDGHVWLEVGGVALEPATGPRASYHELVRAAPAGGPR